MADRSDEILIEIQKITDHYAFQKKITKWSLVVLLIWIIVCFVAVLVIKFKMDDFSGDGKEPYDMYDVTAANRDGDFERALKISNELLIARPLDPDLHYQRGKLLILMGNREDALKSFQKAAEIFPIPRHTDAVKALSPK